MHGGTVCVRPSEHPEVAYLPMMSLVHDGVHHSPPLATPVRGRRGALVLAVKQKGSYSSCYQQFAAALSTSINYFDSTAHDWMHGVLDDLGMRHAGFYSANMNDLMDARERERLLAFADDFTAAIASDETVPRLHQPLPYVPAPLPAAAACAAGSSTAAPTRARTGSPSLARTCSGRTSWCSRGPS